MGEVDGSCPDLEQHQRQDSRDHEPGREQGEADVDGEGRGDQQISERNEEQVQVVPRRAGGEQLQDRHRHGHVDHRQGEFTRHQEKIHREADHEHDKNHQHRAAREPGMAARDILPLDVGRGQSRQIDGAGEPAEFAGEGQRSESRQEQLVEHCFEEAPVFHIWFRSR